MKLLMILADGFEDVEAIATSDVLLRGKEIVDRVSVTGNNEIISKNTNKLRVNFKIDEVDIASYDGLIIPGGPASFTILDKLPIVNDLIHYFMKENKLVSAICAAPFLIGRLGYLSGKNFTVHPGFEDQVIGGTYLREKGVVRDGNIITAKSMYYSIEFGLAIYEYFHGREAAKQLETSLIGEK